MVFIFDFLALELAHDLVYLLKLLAHIQVEVDTIKSRCPFMFLVRSQFPVCLHIGTCLRIQFMHLRTVDTRLVPAVECQHLYSVLR